MKIGGIYLANVYIRSDEKYRFVKFSLVSVKMNTYHEAIYTDLFTKEKFRAFSRKGYNYGETGDLYVDVENLKDYKLVLLVKYPEFNIEDNISKKNLLTLFNKTLKDLYGIEDDEIVIIKTKKLGGSKR